MNIDELQEESYANSAAHGFHDDDSLGNLITRVFGQAIDQWSSAQIELFNAMREQWDHNQDSKRLLLSVGELLEAHEEIRAGHSPTEIYYPHDDGAGNRGKPEGVPIELADAMIRIADYAESRRINLTQALQIKAKYNTGRARMHGKKF